MMKESLEGTKASPSWAFIVVLTGLILSFALIACEGTPNNPGDGGSGGDKAAVNDESGSKAFTCEGDTCTLTGEITEDITLTADKKWLLKGGVFIGDKEDQDGKVTTLTIEPGTTIYGDTASKSMLVIRMGSKIMAEGTKDKPIVFTSAKEPGSRARGDWGGLIINGKAKLNTCKEGTCTSIGEGDTGKYGGDNDADNSGVLKYVRVEFAGKLISPDNELNGIAFQGVGSGTKVEYIQVHMNKDDGVEFFGGAVNVKYVVLTGIADDSLDWTDGWRGKAQFVLIRQASDASDNGIEADNNGEDNAATPRSNPMLSNFTIIGSPDSEKSDLGVLLREGTAGKLSNFVVVKFNDACFSLDNGETFTNAQNNKGALAITNSYFDCTNNWKEPKEAGAFKVEDFLKTMNENNKFMDPMLSDPLNLDAAGYMPKTDSPVLSGAQVPSDSFFTQVQFIGAFGTDDWAAGWTTSAKN